MAEKPEGLCPFCQNVVKAVVVEENTFRRDVCKCPKCGERILICRGVECTDYAKGGRFYDDEMCWPCTKGAAAGLKESIFKAAQDIKNKR